jgi:hypothetical protein
MAPLREGRSLGCGGEEPERCPAPVGGEGAPIRLTGTWRDGGMGGLLASRR